MEHTTIKKLSILVLLLLLLFTYCNPRNTNNVNQSSIESLDILAVVPTSSDSNNYPQPKWERGEEIIPAAENALDEITGSQSIQNLSMYQLNIVPILTERCNPLINIEAFVGKFISRDSRNKPIAIVGYFCDNVVQFLSPLVGHDGLGIVQISAMPPITSNTKNADHNVPPHFHHILPSPLVLADVSAMLIHRLGLSEIGVISSGRYHDQHYSKMAEAFLPIAKKYNISIVSHISSSPRLNNLEMLKKSTARVYFIFLPPSEAIDVICNTYLHGFVWPHYAWVYVELYRDDITYGSEHCSDEDLNNAKQNIMLIHLNLLESYPFNVASRTDNSSSYSRNLNQHSNVYANVLSDSIWAIALAVKQSLAVHSHKGYPIKAEWIEEGLKQLSFHGATGLLNFSQNPAAVEVVTSVTQLHKGEPTEIASYSSALRQFTFLNLSKLENALSKKQDRLYLLYPPYLIYMLSALLLLCLIFTTVTVSLFIYYRKTPKVKATSFTLSLCMFVGCYSLIVSSLLHTVSSSTVTHGRVLRYAICWGNTFLFTVSIDLVLATVFAKTLRIYHIFNKFGKINRLWSDKGLFVLILAIVSGKVVIMIIWALVDVNHLIDEVSTRPEGFPPRYIVVQKCYSHHLGWWLTLVFGYSVALSIPMLHVAILTRKVSRKDFKDSKAITTLVAVIFILTCIGSTLWGLLRTVDADIASKVVYSLAFSSVAVLCQMFLFVPRIIPPKFMMKLSTIKNRVKIKSGSYTDYAYRRISQT